MAIPGVKLSAPSGQEESGSLPAELAGPGVHWAISVPHTAATLASLFPSSYVRACALCQ